MYTVYRKLLFQILAPTELKLLKEFYELFLAPSYESGTK